MPLVLDSPGLQHLSIFDYGGLGSIQNMPHLETAYVGHLVPQPNDKFLRSFSSVGSLHLRLMDVECFSAINFPRLMKFKLHLFKRSFSELRPGYSEYCSLEPLMLFLHNSLILKFLRSATMWVFTTRTSHFRGTNKVLYRDACWPILKSLCGISFGKEEDKRENVWNTSLQTQSV
uniref:FBD domain-containing protein n=1 Tax=Brassica campestris TaxID=3711 RepID=A0A3P5ZK14_BRACM|nr:unnamed protein product [Brassica rapa]